MQEFISNVDLRSNGARKTFVKDSNITKAEEYITKSADIRPTTRTTKLENAVGIKQWIDDHQSLLIEYIRHHHVQYLSILKNL